jgi:hypothetical protein
MRVYRRRRGIAPFILNLGTRRRRVVRFTLRPIYHQERTPFSIEERIEWSPDPFGTFWRCEKSLASTGVSYKGRDM